jgi:Trm5-related predicted tRNA methylase
MAGSQTVSLVPAALQVVFLSPDAPEVLETVDPGVLYVLGGIVDRTPQKYKSLFFAREFSLEVCQLC